MHGQPEGCRELPMEVVSRKGRNCAHRIQIQIIVQMLVNVIQRPLHPGMICVKRYLHRSILRGNAS